MWGYEKQFVISVNTFFAQYGWYLVGSTIALLYLYSLVKPMWNKYCDFKYDEKLKKNPDLALARAEAVERARLHMQERLAAESARAAVLQKQREEKKKQENAERLQRYLADNSGKLGHRLGTGGDDYMPLSGGGSTSSYKAPKRKCPGGGCGR